MNARNFTRLLAITVLVSFLPLTEADLTRKLNKIVEKYAEDETETKESIFLSTLQNITITLSELRKSFDQWNQVVQPSKINRQSLSGCELIPTDLDVDKPAFFFCKAEVNWHMADQHCKVHGMRLAVVDNSVAFDTVANFLNNYRGKMNLTTYSAWIGGTDLGNEGHWYWAPNGRLITWGNWLPGQPDNYKDNEHCLMFWKRASYHKMAFNDWPCNLPVSFICETNEIL